MLTLRCLEGCDAVKIANWPVYPGDMYQMDYALRKQGWLEECASAPDTFLYAADEEGDLVGFTILALTAPTEAEFRIALRADRTGQGLGGRITVDTLRIGFSSLGLDRIHLIVRKNNHRGIRLYRRLGFSGRGECRKSILGEAVDFWLMDLSGADFLQRYGRDL